MTRTVPLPPLIVTTAPLTAWPLLVTMRPLKAAPAAVGAVTVNEPLMSVSAGVPSLKLKLCHVSGVLEFGAPTTFSFRLISVPCPASGDVLKAFRIRCSLPFMSVLVLVFTDQPLLSVPLVSNGVAGTCSTAGSKNMSKSNEKIPCPVVLPTVMGIVVWAAVSCLFGSDTTMLAIPSGAGAAVTLDC